jgi:hypothetical protein
MPKRNRKNKKQVQVIQVTQVRVPYAIRHGLIEGFSFPYVEPLVQEQVSNQPIIIESTEDDPITYYKETRGSGLFAIRCIKS